MKKTFFRRATTFVMAALTASTVVLMDRAWAQDAYPTRPISIIVPYNAGGGMDNVIRKMVPALEAELGQPVQIKNLAGAGGNVGTSALKDSAPDGYTIGMSGGSTFGTNQIFNKTVPYDAAIDFEFVSMIGNLPRVVVVSESNAAKTLKELATQIKTEPKFNMAAALNSPDILMAEIFRVKTNPEAVVVSYGGNTNVMMVDLLGGRLHAVWNSVPALHACLSNNTCRALAVNGPSRLKELPTVPTFQEAGMPDVDAPAYYGIVTPKGVDAQKVLRLNQAFNRVLSRPDIQAMLSPMGVVVTIATPGQTKATHLNGIVAAQKHAAAAKIIAK